jgi:hypothetical protein
MYFIIDKCSGKHIAEKYSTKLDSNLKSRDQKKIIFLINYSDVTVTEVAVQAMSPNIKMGIIP